MTSARTGSPIGFIRRGTVQGFDLQKGLIKISVDESGLSGNPLLLNLPMPVAWVGTKGEFAGGRPVIGSTVSLQQGAGGEWFFVNYLASGRNFGTSETSAFSSAEYNKIRELKSGEYLIQVENKTYLSISPRDGIFGGKPSSYWHLDPNRNLLSQSVGTGLKFLESGFEVSNLVRRDLGENSNRSNVDTLRSHVYEDSLFAIGLDPTSKTSISNSGLEIRNPPLVEKRNVYYEFAQSFEIQSDQEELSFYGGPAAKSAAFRNNKFENRTTSLSLSLHHPNALVETIYGTVVDRSGNVLDLNYGILPLGRGDLRSFTKNSDKGDAYVRNRSVLRKSIAFHFGLNNRTGGLENELMLVPNPSTVTDYARKESQFRLDVDKEGQIFMNVPASSEIGNLGLLTRHGNFSSLKSVEDPSFSPKDFSKAITGQDIFLKGFAGKANITLQAETAADGYAAYLDYLTGLPIKYGTVFHDITRVCSEFQTKAGYVQAGVQLVNFDKDNILNTVWTPLPKIVSETITVSGPNSNAGGRSATVNFDGFVNYNYGANTIDRQSFWVDTAGGGVVALGKDKQNISLAMGADGDILIQIGGPGIGNTYDSRFANLNDAYRNGTLEIRVQVNGQNSIWRMGPEGTHIISPGKLVLESQQDMILKTNSNLILEGEVITMYGTTEKRVVKRFGGTIG